MSKLFCGPPFFLPPDNGRSGLLLRSSRAKIGLLAWLAGRLSLASFRPAVVSLSLCCSSVHACNCFVTVSIDHNFSTTSTAARSVLAARSLSFVGGGGGSYCRGRCCFRAAAVVVVAAARVLRTVYNDNSDSDNQKDRRRLRRQQLRRRNDRHASRASAAAVDGGGGVVVVVAAVRR